MIPTSRRIKYYLTLNGRAPFIEWLESLRDRQIQQIIDARLTRIQQGLFGHARFVGFGVTELKIDVGPGYRVYFGIDGLTIVILLTGGTKSSQEKDIEKAQLYWHDYTRRTKK